MLPPPELSEKVPSLNHPTKKGDPQAALEENLRFK
jgi:hypothetical protein